MLEFFLTVSKLARALLVVWKDKEARHILILVLGLIVLGAIFYASVEGWSIVDSLYFSVVTLATVGYGDLSPKTTFGKVFTIIYILVGVGLFVAVAQGLARGLIRGKNQKNSEIMANHDKSNSN